MTKGSQNTPAITKLDGGGFKIAWIDSDGAAGTGLYTRAFTASAAPAGDQILLNTYKSSSFLNPLPALDATGRTTVAFAAPAGTAGRYDLFVQRYLFSNLAENAPLRASPPADAGNSSIGLAADDFGNLIVLWANTRACAQRFATTTDPAVVGGRIWDDLNANGLQDPGETGRDGVTVLLYNSSSVLVSSTVTAAGGVYRFDVPMGEGAYVFSQLPGNFIFSPQNTGADDSIDSDVASATGQSPAFTIVTGRPAPLVDAGLCSPAAIKGRVFFDSNANGLQDQSETGIGAVTIRLLNSAGALVGSTTTSADGTYAFTGLIPGMAYRVEFVPAAGMLFTTSEVGNNDAIDSDADPISGRTGAIAPIPGQTIGHVDAGLVPAATVAGTVFFDANGNAARDPGELALAGFVVFADINGNALLDSGEISCKTDSAGKYSLTGLRFGQVAITQLPQHMWQMAAARPYTLTPGQNLGGIDLPNIALARNTVAAPIGPLLTASTDATFAKADVASAAGANGNFVIVWTSIGQDGSGGGIYGQRYSADGQPLGGEFLINTTTVAHQSLPTVAMDSHGAFVVAWAGQDTSGSGIFAQRFDANGNKLGGEVIVNSFQLGEQSGPSLAMDAAGNYIVVWESFGQDGSGYGIYAQRFNADGAARGAEFRISPDCGTYQTEPAVAMSADGGFVAAWPDERSGSVNLYARRFDAAAQPLGDVFRVNTTSVAPAQKPAVGMNADGEFTIAWQTGTAGVYAQRYDSAASPLGAEITVDNKAQEPSVAMDGDGGVIVLWSNSGFRAQRYNASGLPNGDSIPAGSAYQSASVAIDALGYFVICGCLTTTVQVQRYTPNSGWATIGGIIWNDRYDDGIRKPDDPLRAGGVRTGKIGQAVFMAAFRIR